MSRNDNSDGTLVRYGDGVDVRMLVWNLIGDSNQTERLVNSNEDMKVECLHTRWRLLIRTASKQINWHTTDSDDKGLHSCGDVRTHESRIIGS
jgi:hypothetical protein